MGRPRTSPRHRLELHDSAILRRKDKRYVVGRRNEKGAGSWPYCELPRVIPAELRRDQSVKVSLPVGDDLAANRDRLQVVRLCFLLDNLTGPDKLEAFINGARADCPMNPIRPGQYLPHATAGSLLSWQYYDLRNNLPRMRNNTVEVRLAARNSDFEKPWSQCRLVLSDVELEIKYRWPAADWSPPKGGEF